MISYQGRNRATLNYLKTIYFDNPEWTICAISLMPATWIKYRERLEEVVLAHPRCFPGYVKGSKNFDDVGTHPLYHYGNYTDGWGVVWKNIEHGLDSISVNHPLEDWAALDTYVPPDPMVQGAFGKQPDWEQVRRDMAASKAKGGLASGGGLPHGFMYMYLYYLRGFDNLMLDLATDDPRLHKLIAMLERYNVAVVNKYIELGAELMSFGDDLGSQKALPMSPTMWRKFIKPSYSRILAPCRARDIPVHLHTDGHILEIIPDLIEVGVRILNPQIRANGLEGLQRMARGKVALFQDLDRQLFPFATPSQIEEHIGTVYEGLYLPEGGLMLHAECEPDVPLENIDAICTILERICKLPEPEVLLA